jgi:hypothetical protein
MFRFSVRQAPLFGRYGVLDSHANDWYSDWILTEPEASRQVSDLDVLYDFYTERPPRHVRRPGAGGAGSATNSACTTGTAP